MIRDKFADLVLGQGESNNFWEIMAEYDRLTAIEAKATLLALQVERLEKEIANKSAAFDEYLRAMENTRGLMDKTIALTQMQEQEINRLRSENADLLAACEYALNQIDYLQNLLAHGARRASRNTLLRGTIAKARGAQP